MQFQAGGPARSLAEAAVGREGEAVGRSELQAAADSLGNVLWRFDEVAFDVDDAHCHVAAFGDGADDLQLGILAVGHLDVNLVDVHLKKGRKHGRVATETDRMALVVAKTEMRRQPASAHDGLDGAIEDVDKAERVFAVGVAAHGRFVDGDFVAAGGDEGF